MVSQNLVLVDFRFSEESAQRIVWFDFSDAEKDYYGKEIWM